MSTLHPFVASRSWQPLAIVAAGLALVSLQSLLPALRGQDEPTSAPRAARAAMATGTCAPGLILRREKPDRPWEFVKENEALHSENLLLGLPGARLQTDNGAVELVLLTDLDARSPSPVKEAAVIVHEGQGADLNLTLDRGRIEMTNRKERGTALVRFRVQDAVFTLTLPEPGDSVALELSSRWLPGVPFRKNPEPDHAPFADLIVLVRKGNVSLKHDGVEYGLHAPPGSAFMEWDSAYGLDAGPQRLGKLPSWAEPGTGQNTPAVLESFRAAILVKGIETTLSEFLDSKNEEERRLAVFVLAATDDLERLHKVMTSVKHPDVWENGVLALRGWIGRSADQDLRLYKVLIENRQFTPAQAAILLQLLHSFGEAQLARPETYELLIDLLQSDKLGIRGLAYWHLYRLAPAGRKLGYRPLARKEERQQAVQRWRKLIPAGQLPPRSGSKAK